MEQAPAEKKLKFKTKNVNEQNVVFNADSGLYIEMLHPKGWEGWWFNEQQKALQAYEDMIEVAEAEGKNSERYEELKKIWRDKKDAVIEAEKRVPPEVVEQQVEAGATRNKVSIQQALDKIEKEAKELKANDDISILRFVELEKSADPSPTPEAAKPILANPPVAEAQPQSKAWMGVFDTYTGGKAPEGPGSVAEIERYVKRVAMSQGKNTLAYAYAESLLRDAKAKPVRQEAEKHRDEAARLEQEQTKLIQELEALKQKEKEGVGPFEDPVDKKVSQTEKEKEKIQKELKLVKKGWGAKFADGFKKLFGKFSKNHEKELKLGGLDEYGFIHKPETVKRLDEYGFVHEEKKPEEPPVALSEALKEEKIVPVEEPEKAAKTVESGAIQPNEDIVRQIDEAVAKTRAAEATEEEKSKKEKEAVKGATVWGWFKERAKGVATMGLWEVGRATGFYAKTKRVGIETGAQAELLEQEKGLLWDENEAWDEALEIDEKVAGEEKDWVANYGAEPERARKLAVKSLSEQISSRKKERNFGKENTMVLLALQKLEDRLKNKVVIGKEYMAAHGGQMITPEKMAAAEKRLREAIGQIRKGQTRKDLVNFAKLYRESLDDKWWARYIYGALEAVGIYAGWKLVVSPGLFGSEAIKTAVGGAAGAEGARETAKYADQTGLQDTIWQESRRLLEKIGIANPNHGQIQKVSEVMAKDSGVSVVKSTGELLWPGTAGGVAKDIALPRGFLLMLKGATKAALDIKAAAGM